MQCWVQTNHKREMDGDNDFFDIIAGVLQWDRLALNMFMNCLDNVLCTSIDPVRDLVLHYKRQEADIILQKL